MGGGGGGGGGVWGWVRVLALRLGWVGGVVALWVLVEVEMETWLDGLMAADLDLDLDETAHSWLDRVPECR